MLDLFQDYIHLEKSVINNGTLKQFKVTNFNGYQFLIIKSRSKLERLIVIFISQREVKSLTISLL